MNETNWEHALFALIGMAVIAVLVLYPAFLLVGSLKAAIIMSAASGAFATGGFFTGREHSQYEAKLVKRRNCQINDLHPLDGFDFKNWSLDAKLDLIFPIIGNTIAFGVITLVAVILL